MGTPENILEERRRIWGSKDILKKLYHGWYGIIGDVLRPGNVLELGGGSGNLKEFFPDTISSDILFTPWLDAVLDAHDLPFRDESLDNIVLFDVLHHIRKPVAFFCEALRALRRKGRIILMEPYVSWTSFFVYKFLHREGLVWRVDPFSPEYSLDGNDPFHSNQAIPTLMFEKYRKRFDDLFPHLKIIREERMDGILYPLSGGFHNPSMCPRVLWPLLDGLEGRLRPLSRFMAFRLFVVVEKV